MAVHPEISKSSNSTILPHRWTTLYELSTSSAMAA